MLHSKREISEMSLNILSFRKLSHFFEKVIHSSGSNGDERINAVLYICPFDYTWIVNNVKFSAAARSAYCSQLQALFPRALYFEQNNLIKTIRPSDVPHHIWVTDLRQREIPISQSLSYAYIPFKLPRAKYTNSTVFISYQNQHADVFGLVGNGNFWDLNSEGAYYKFWF